MDNASRQTYTYDIMAKDNADFLSQVSDDFILYRYFNDIIKNPDVLGSVLKDKHSQAFQYRLSSRKGASMCVCTCIRWAVSYLEQGVVLKERTNNFGGVFRSVFEIWGDLDGDRWFSSLSTLENKRQTNKYNSRDFFSLIVTLPLCVLLYLVLLRLTPWTGPLI